MNKEYKQRWIEALRSGAYKQGYRRLRTQLRMEDTPEYCCLGVLCDLTGMTYDPYDGILPNHIANECELKRSPQVTLPNGIEYELWRLNDNNHNDIVQNRKDLPTKQLTFTEIADLIEEQL